MDDLLGSAQKAINDAANAANSAAPPATPSSPPPPEPAPEPPASPQKPSSPRVEAGQGGPVEKAGVVDALLSTPSSPPEAPPPPSPKKKAPKTAIIAALLLFFITIPLTVYYVSQQQQIADIRSSAAPPPKESCSGCAGDGTAWKIVRGECKKVEDKSCKPDNPPPGQKKCSGYGAAGCTGYPGSSCGDGGQCVMIDPDNGACACQGQNNRTVPAATPTPIPQCINIKIYKDNAVVTPATLRAGDAVVLAVKGTNATKGRIRVNGGTFTETTTKNASDEYTVNFTIPTSTTSFTVEAEVFVNGAWQ